MHTSLSIESLVELENQLLQDLEAVRRLKALVERGGPPVLTRLNVSEMHSAPLVQVNRIPQARPSVEALTRQALTELDGSFGIGEVKARVRMHSPRGFGDVAIRAQLKRLEQEGELVLTSQGLGRAGNQYAKTSRFQPSPLL
jgi:hypothetical protein